MDLFKIPFVVLICLSTMVAAGPTSRLDFDAENKLLNRVPRKSVFIAPKIFTTEGIQKCPTGFVRSMGSLCVEVIQPSPKALDSVLLERLKMIEYDYEEYGEEEVEEEVVMVEVEDPSSTTEPSTTGYQNKRHVTGIDTSVTSTTDAQTLSTTSTFTSTTETTSTTTTDNSIQVEDNSISYIKNFV